MPGLQLFMNLGDPPLTNLVSENDTIILKTQKVGMYNGTKMNFASMTYYPEGIAESVKEKASRKVGDTVSTDIMEVTIKKAALGYYATFPKAADNGKGVITNIGYSFTACPTVNIIMNAGECVEIKYVGIVGFEPDDLSSPFDVIVKMKNSNDEEESFIFTIE